MGDKAAGKKQATLSEGVRAAALPDDRSRENKASDVLTATSGTDDVPAQRSPDSTAQNNSRAEISQPRVALNRGSWSWRAKASPVAQVAKESISVAGGVSSGSAEQRRPSQSISKSVKGSRKSIPLIAEATRVNAISDVADKSVPPPQKSKKILKHSEAAEEKANTIEDESREYKLSTPVEAAPLPPDPVLVDGNSDVDAKGADIRPQSGNWMSWWSRPDGYGSDGEKAMSDRAAKKPRLTSAEEEARSTPLPSPAANEQDSISGRIIDTGDSSGDAEDKSMRLKPEMAMNPSANRSWFRLWSSAQNEQAAEEEKRRKEAENAQEDDTSVKDASTGDVPVEPVVTAAPASNRAPETIKAKDSASEDGRPKSSGWAFWSAEKLKGETRPPTPGGTQKQIGELAVADTPSQSHPEAAQFNEQHNQQQGRSVESKRSENMVRPKRNKTEKDQNTSREKDLTPTSVAPHLQEQSQEQKRTASESQPLAEIRNVSSAPVQHNKRPQVRPNLISPSFRESYPAAPSHGYLERLAAYLAQTLHLPGSEPPRPPLHPFVSATPLKVKKAIAIGVHGFFPAAVFQKVLGQPTGTSIRFANYAASGIKQWCQEHQPEVKDVHVEKVALEGEGNIADRVATLWKLLLNWLSHLRQADFILVAAHSQGVPVAIMLVAKLLQLGALAPHVRIGICAMAGINLGPFIEYKSRLFGSTALELFDFCDSGSKVSKTYAEAMDICLRHSVRVTFVGSLDDQLVSLESSLHAPLSHPYVSRAIFIDGRLHTHNFLIHLVIFAVKLRNRGISDHGLLREVSAPLAGSIVGGEGHSRVYDDAAVYACATEFALESTDMPVSSQVQSLAREALGEEEREKLAARRASLSGYPREMTIANNMRRGSQGLSLPGIAPVIAQYHANPNQASGSASAVSTMEKNPFVLPWAVRGMLEEEAVRRDPELQAEVKELVKEFEEWKPAGKGLKDVRWRLEGVRSLL